MAERRLQLGIATGLVAALIGGCAGLPAGPGAPASDRAPTGASAGVPSAPRMHPATAALLDEATRQQRAGNLAQASATLERAVRIDPGEPAVWLELARVRYAEGNWRQAGQLARRASSLARPGSPVADDAAEVLEAARRREDGR